MATICLSIPISTASAGLSYSDMKLIKNHLCNCLELSWSNLMMGGLSHFPPKFEHIFVIEFADKLTDSNLEEIVDVWNRNGRQISV